MSYESIQSISALAGLILFLTLFAGMLVYVFWPSNATGFDEASRIPFSNEKPTTGGKP